MRALQESTMVLKGVKAVAGAGVAAAFALTAAMSVAAAQDVSPQVVVPDHGGGAGGVGGGAPPPTVADLAEELRQRACHGDASPSGGAIVGGVPRW